MESSTLQPEQKAAAVIVALGAEKASKIYKHLSEGEIEKLTVEVAKSRTCFFRRDGTCSG